MTPSLMLVDEGQTGAAPSAAGRAGNCVPAQGPSPGVGLCPLGKAGDFPEGDLGCR